MIEAEKSNAEEKHKKKDDDHDHHHDNKSSHNPNRSQAQKWSDDNNNAGWRDTDGNETSWKDTTGKGAGESANDSSNNMGWGDDKGNETTTGGPDWDDQNTGNKWPAEDDNDKPAWDSNNENSDWNKNNNDQNPNTTGDWENNDSFNKPKSNRSGSRKSSVAGNSDDDYRRRYVQPYWRQQVQLEGSKRPHHRQPRSLSRESLALRNRPYKVTEDFARSRDLEHQVQAGHGVEQKKKAKKPNYWDPLDRPYAVFTFKYRSKGKAGPLQKPGLQRD
jgi:hypothetical protein